MQQKHPTASQPAIETYVSNSVRYIIFDRPEKLNALTTDELVTVTELTLAPGEEVRALVYTGRGNRSFSVGMHVNSFVGNDPDSAKVLIRKVRDFVSAVRTSSIPTMAMINGYCLGAAFELALACDLRVAVDTALFGLPEVKVGIPSVVDAALLQEHVGLSMAKEIILTGDLYPVETLQRLGLINRVVSTQQSLQSATSDLLGRITRHTRTVLASQKRLFELWLNTPLSVGIESSVEEFSRVFESTETLEQIQRHIRTLAEGRDRNN